MKKNYRFSSLQQVLECFEASNELSPTEIAEQLSKSRAIVHRYLGYLVETGKLKKVWTTPHVRYMLALENTWKMIDRKTDISQWILPYQVQKKLNAIFLKFSPLWARLDGTLGFSEWCMDWWLDTLQKAEQYLKIADYIDTMQDDCGLLDATEIFDRDFESSAFSHVYYADQYTWMDFGRGKLAELTFYAKLTQNRSLLEEVISSIMPKLQCLIARERIDAIAITPWSIERKNQLLSILSKKLKTLGIPQISLVKYYKNNITIPQKSLKTKNERIQNARNTIFVEDTSVVGEFQNILLIDDFVWSGATLYETAQKLRQAGAPRIIWFAFVWNTNLSYDVINEI
jgi:predicted amidophosphoribosyltransferase